MSSRNSFKEGSRISRYENLISATFKPNQEGVSEWVTVDVLISKGFKWTKNGNVRRGVPFGDKKYQWEFKRKTESKTSEILALRTVGFNTSNRVSSAIRSDILSKLREKGICNFSLLPVPIQDREVDHRFGYKEHPKYLSINELSNQKIEHFQLLHHAQNVQKRQMCKVCIDTKIRPPHPEKGFVIGDSKLDDRHVCHGCYLAQPELYR